MFHLQLTIRPYVMIVRSKRPMCILRNPISWGPASPSDDEQSMAMLRHAMISSIEHFVLGLVIDLFKLPLNQVNDTFFQKRCGALATPVRFPSGLPRAVEPARYAPTP